jgi:hypothetical protein
MNQLALLKKLLVLLFCSIFVLQFTTMIDNNKQLCDHALYMQIIDNHSPTTVGYTVADPEKLGKYLERVVVEIESGFIGDYEKHYCKLCENVIYEKLHR